MVTPANSTTQEGAISLEIATNWARSNSEWEKVYRYIFLCPSDFFAIIPGRKWPIAHQVIFHGNIDIFKRILALFSDDQINIQTKSSDDKTLLDVAADKRNVHPAMYTYTAHLFAQDQLIDGAKKSNWRSVTDLLENNKQLGNEKPPYSPGFLLHYVVENGDAEILETFLATYQLLTNVLNDKKETPLDMAIRLNKYDMCSILQPQTTTRPPFSQIEPQVVFRQNLHRPDERVTFHSPAISPDDHARIQLPTSMPSPPANPLVPTTKLPCIGFGHIVLDMNPSGDFTVEPQPLINSSRAQPVSTPRRPSNSGIQHVPTNKTIVSEYPLANSNPPRPSPPPPPLQSKVSTASNEQVMKNLTCSITQKLFVDPVIASDGQTYERAAIFDWVNVCGCSPTTGAPMDATFIDNTEIKQIIQSIQKQS